MESFLRNGVLQINYINLQFVFLKKTFSLESTWLILRNLFGFHVGTKITKGRTGRKIGTEEEREWSENNEIYEIDILFILNFIEYLPTMN